MATTFCWNPEDPERFRSEFRAAILNHRRGPLSRLKGHVDLLEEKISAQLTILFRNPSEFFLVIAQRGIFAQVEVRQRSLAPGSIGPERHPDVLIASFVVNLPDPKPKAPNPQMASA